MAFLYLDESGKFQDNINFRSVIGGFFSIQNLPKGKIEDFYNKFDESFFDDDKRFHGLNLSNEQLSQFIDALIDMLDTNQCNPVLFIPTKRFFIIDDSTTYINVLTDGIVKFLKRVEMKYDIASCTIVIEYRKGSSTDDYKQRIIEALEKKRVLSGLLKKDLQINILVDSKNNRHLQLADAIVHTYYRLDTPSTFTKDAFDTTIKKKFYNWIEQGKVYVYSSQELDDLIYDYIYEGDYINAFLQLVHNVVEDTGNKKNIQNNNKLVEAFIHHLCQLELEYMNTILMLVLSLYYNAINVKRFLGEFENDILFIAHNFLPLLGTVMPQYNKQPEDINWAYCYCYMMLLTLYNHRGDCYRFEKIYNQADNFLKRIPFDIDSLTNSIRIKVLYGVHLTNMYQFKNCFERMKNLEQKVTDAFAFLSESDENVEVKPRIIGEIIGTKLQAAMYNTLISNSNDWDTVRTFSNEAIQNFIHSQDISRQYQYRAQIETYAGCYTEARMFLAKSIGMNVYDNDELLLKTIIEKKLIFPLFHFLRIYYVELMRGIKEHINDCYSIMTKVCGQLKDEFKSMMALQEYPIHSMVHYLMVLYWLYNSKSSQKEAMQLYNTACSLYEKYADANITFLTMEQHLYASYIWLKAYVNGEKTNTYRNDFLIKFEKLLKSTRDLPIHDYLLTVKTKYEQTPEVQWNTLWYYFPF